jgi:uncharacterized protein (TIGR03643 family)
VLPRVQLVLSLCASQIPNPVGKGFFSYEYCQNQREMSADLLPSQISEIVEMALSDHISFNMITQQHGVTPDEVKAIMRSNLKPGSYKAWRKRVRDFGDRREHYK